MISRIRLLGSILLVSISVQLFAAEDAEPQVSLMSMLSEWMYPEAGFHGAETSDAAVTGISAIKSKAMLTTPDEVEKVMSFYCEKLHVDREGKYLDEKPGDRITSDRTVLIQDLSGDEQGTLYVIAINGRKSSTTLVVARAEGEEVTRIGWSNYRQLAP